MFADPQTVTVNAVAQSLLRTESGENRGQFRHENDSYRLTISHDYGKTAIRRMVRLDHNKVVPDPLFPQQNVPYTAGVWLVVQEPASVGVAVGYTNAELKQIVDGFTAWTTANSSSVVTKLLAGES